MNGTNLLTSLFNREIDASFNSKFRKQYIFSKTSIEHLNLESELRGHEGCVNTLEWNQSGTLLASGSDDLKINIWNPLQKSLLKSIDTKHRGNIFSVKFLPGTNDGLIASAAADRNIYVYDLNKNSYLNEIHSHQNRVKRLTTAESVPFLFWSCGEDGFILQHDIRCPSKEITRLLLDFAHLDSPQILDAKTLAINQMRPELIAVGNNDPYARVYDRRMIKLMTYSSRNNGQNNGLDYSLTKSKSSKHLFEYSLVNEVDNIPITYYTPGHLPMRVNEYRKRMKTLSITCLTFSPDGRELLVNLGGEQIYLFDVNNDGKSVTKFKYDSFRESLKNVDYENNIENNENLTKNQFKKKKYKLPVDAEELKIKANACFEQANYVEAIEFYNLAVQICPDSPILYGNRAASFMKRNWDSDNYMAMLDCYKALSLDIMHLKSHFRLVRCLYELKWYNEAKECLDIFVKRFPDYADSNACDTLVNDIETTLLKEKEKLSKKKKDQDSSSDSDSDSDNEYNQFLTKRKKNNTSTSDSNSPDKSNEDNLESVLFEKKKIKLQYKNYLKAKEDAIDIKSRYCGHCNVSTDIKEACFLGTNYISAGSDDGSFFIWDKTTTNVVRVLRGDESIVNCIQPHPFNNMIATSGIDPHVRIWTPQLNDETLDERDTERVVTDIKEASLNNQRQMNSHPFEFLLLNLAQSQNDEASLNDEGSVGCRPS